MLDAVDVSVRERETGLVPGSAGGAGGPDGATPVVSVIGPHPLPSASSLFLARLRWSADPRHWTPMYWLLLVIIALLLWDVLDQFGVLPLFPTHGLLHWMGWPSH